MLLTDTNLYRTVRDYCVDYYDDETILDIASAIVERDLAGWECCLPTPTFTALSVTTA